MKRMKVSVAVIAVLVVALCCTHAAASPAKSGPKGIKLVPAGIYLQGDAGHEQLVKLVFTGGKVSRGAVATAFTIGLRHVVAGSNEPGPSDKLNRGCTGLRKALRKVNDATVVAAGESIWRNPE